MKTIILTIFLLSASPTDTLTVFFWNLENFFDYRDSGLSPSDSEFSSSGARHWTKKRFYAKCRAVAKTLMCEGMPDIAAFAEVENAYVLKQIVNSTILRKSAYVPVHFESPDPRGIDVGLLYRKDRLELLKSRPVGIPEVKTRDILYAEFSLDSSAFAVCVNHHPSKYGGEAISAGKRKAAVETLSATAASSCLPVIACGDFNDTPDSDVFGYMDKDLVNASDSLFRKGRGTIKYDGNWELIDMFFISNELVPYAVVDICSYPFLFTKDSAHGGLKPRRTYSGPRYNGGVSDHLPIIAKIVFNQ